MDLLLGQIIWNIIKTYQEIYDEEEDTKIGKYGIWGHAIGDLYLEGLSYCAEEKKVYLFMGS